MSRVSRPVATPRIILVFASHQTPRITQPYPPESHLAAAGSVFRMGLSIAAYCSECGLQCCMQLSAHYIAGAALFVSVLRVGDFPRIQLAYW